MAQKCIQFPMPTVLFVWSRTRPPPNGSVSGNRPKFDGGEGDRSPRSWRVRQLPDPFLMRSQRVLSISDTFFVSNSSSSDLAAPRRPLRDRQNHSETIAKPIIFYRKSYYNGFRRPWKFRFFSKPRVQKSLRTGKNGRERSVSVCNSVAIPIMESLN